MGGEEQKRAHVANVQQHPAEKRDIRRQARGGEDILQNMGGRTGQGRSESKEKGKK